MYIFGFPVALCGGGSSFSCRGESMLDTLCMTRLPKFRKHEETRTKVIIRYIYMSQLFNLHMHFIHPRRPCHTLLSTQQKNQGHTSAANPQAPETSSTQNPSAPNVKTLPSAALLVPAALVTATWTPNALGRPVLPFRLSPRQSKK